MSPVYGQAGSEVLFQYLIKMVSKLATVWQYLVLMQCVTRFNPCVSPQFFLCKRVKRFFSICIRWQGVVLECRCGIVIFKQAKEKCALLICNFVLYLGKYGCVFKCSSLAQLKLCPKSSSYPLLPFFKNPRAFVT